MSLLLLLSLIPSWLHAGARPDPMADRAAILTLQAAYEDAVNAGDLKALLPHLSRDFQGDMVTGDKVSGRGQLLEFWGRLSRALRDGDNSGSYRVRLHPEEVRIDGDSAQARGSTSEEVVLPDGQVLRYSSVWSSRLRREGGRWVIAGLESEADLRDKITVAARVIASRWWPRSLALRRQRLAAPDFDGDGGRRRPQAADAAAPKRSAPASNASP